MSFFGSACGDMGGSLTKANDLISSCFKEDNGSCFEAISF